MEFYLELRSLVVETCGVTDASLLDSGVTLSILQMQPLQSLILRGNVQVRGILSNK